MDNITVIKLNALAKQRGIKDYYKLRKPELIHKLEDHPDVNDKVIINTGVINTHKRSKISEY